MMNFTNIACGRSSLGSKLLIVLCVAGLLSIAAFTSCAAQEAMAPPIGSAAGSSNEAGSNIFNWQEIPANQNVPIQSATFDQGGYQLYDTVGETIVVPFTNNNLYVMEFAVSDDGTTYFVNTGTAPVLYLPEDGYLTNASDPGAHWYPFTQQWHPTTPVFIGIAPSWHDYIAMGWYPNMAYYGGYWCSGPYLSVGAVTPAFGLFFQIGGAQFSGWGAYASYYGGHPAPYHMTIVNRNIYHWGGRNWQQHAGSGHPFFGSGHPYTYGQGFAGNSRAANGFHGASSTGRQFRGTASGGNAMSGRSGRSFRGAGSSSSGNHTFQGGRSFSAGRASQGSRGGGASHTFRGASGGGSTGGSAHSSGGSHPSGGSGHTFRGAQSGSNNHSQNKH